MVIAYQLDETRSQDFRSYQLAEVFTEFVDAILTIQTGKPGPHGGLSKVCVENYFVQEVFPDPEEDNPSRFFILLKDRPGLSLGEFEFDREDTTAEPYGVYVSTRYRHVGSCNCKGFRTTLGCKHLSTFQHLVSVVGWKNEREQPDQQPQEPCEDQSAQMALASV